MKQSCWVSIAESKNGCGSVTEHQCLWGRDSSAVVVIAYFLPSWNYAILDKFCFNLERFEH